MTVKLDRAALRRFVIQEIEKNFVDSVVIWTGSGIPDEDNDDTEQFEALWIPDEDYDRFRELVWSIEQEVANPNGFSIMVHDLNLEDTRTYRWKEYQDARRLRASESASPKKTTSNIKKAKKTEKRFQEKIR